MPLNKNDLTQIREIVHTEAKSVVHAEIKSEISIALKPINRKLKKISDDINMVINHFDRDYLGLMARVDRLERYLKIPPLTP